MSNIGQTVKMTWKRIQPKSFCSVEYAHGAGNETFEGLRGLAPRARGVHVDNLPKPLNPMNVGAAKDLMSNLDPFVVQVCS
jgi:hypothetical protein